MIQRLRSDPVCHLRYPVNIFTDMSYSISMGGGYFEIFVVLRGCLATPSSLNKSVCDQSELE